MPRYLTNEGLVSLVGAAQLKDNPLEAVSARAAELSKRLESILYFSDIVDNKNLVFEEARVETVEHMKNYVQNIILAEALKAIFLTTEYNYPLYIEHFTNALMANVENLVTFAPESENRTRIIVDFSPLGEILGWENAVIFARTEMRIGRGEEPDMEEASWYWYSRVYAPGREGLAVYSYSKKGGAKDVTEFYSGKYQKTIETRLKYVEDNQAPYWYLIEHGNSPGVMQDRGGAPYPIVAPTRFVSKTEIAIAKIFELVLYRFINKVLSDYAFALSRAYGIGNVSFTVEDINDVFDTIHKLTVELMTREGEPLEPVDYSKIREIISQKALRVIEFTRRGKRQTALVGARGFVSSPISKAKLTRKK